MTRAKEKNVANDSKRRECVPRHIAFNNIKKLFAGGCNMAVITNKSPIIRLDKEDNIVVARAEIKAGTFIPEENVIIKNDIPLGHKFAAHDIKKEKRY